jgi:hypothetical protein
LAPEVSYDAVLLDLDHWPADAGLLGRLSATRRACLVAAHGDGGAGLDPGDRPLDVHERLRPGRLHDLARAARMTVPVPVAEEPVELTWVDLA